MEANAYVCSSCGEEHRRLVGRCSECGEWGTVKEGPRKSSTALARRPNLQLVREGDRRGPREEQRHRAVRSTEAPVDEHEHVPTGIESLDKVLNGGPVFGGVTLFSGDTGTGKSTLTGQLVRALADQEMRCLMVSAEETLGQVNDRLKRIQCQHEEVYLLRSAVLEDVEAEIAELEPDAIVIDSVQRMRSNELPGAAGGVAQVMEIATRLTDMVKDGVPDEEPDEEPLRPILFFVCQVNKDERIAGPKKFEHLVDTMLVFERDAEVKDLRHLRVLKNRFGPEDVVGHFRMTEEGLRDLVDELEEVAEKQKKRSLGRGRKKKR